jgi:hypothetical protein
MHFETNVETGGLMLYGPDFRFTARPISWTRFCVGNQNTATALGIPIPRGVRGRAKVTR